MWTTSRANSRKLISLEVRCYGKKAREPRLDLPTLKATGFGCDTSAYTAPKPLHSVFGAVQRGLDWNTTAIDADLVHLHTWYTHFGGILAKLNYGIPMVLTVHSLEPLRPWKREQLGGGYDFSCWVEKTAIEMADAVIAVSRETKDDILRLFNVPESRVHVIYNGIDLDEYRPVTTTGALEKYGVDPRAPYVLFVGRITRQKGIIHLVRAIQYMDPGFSDRPLRRRAGHAGNRRREMKAAVAAAQAHRRRCRVDRQDGEQRKRSSFSPRVRSSAVRRFTSRSGSSISKRWRARRPSWRAPWAGSRKWWSMARPVSWSRSSR